jgi:hypothetical protein
MTSCGVFNNHILSSLSLLSRLYIYTGCLPNFSSVVLYFVWRPFVGGGEELRTLETNELGNCIVSEIFKILSIFLVSWLIIFLYIMISYTRVHISLRCWLSCSYNALKFQMLLYIMLIKPPQFRTMSDVPVIVLVLDWNGNIVSYMDEGFWNYMHISTCNVYRISVYIHL